MNSSKLQACMQNTAPTPCFLSVQKVHNLHRPHLMHWLRSFRLAKLT